MLKGVALRCQINAPFCIYQIVASGKNDAVQLEISHIAINILDKISEGYRPITQGIQQVSPPLVQTITTLCVGWHFLNSLR